MRKLVDSYLKAWNRRDVKGVLALMHAGASYHDAFWRETCVGRDLAQYFQDFFDEDNYRYRQIGELITTDDGAVMRYAARQADGSDIGALVYVGAEVFTLRDGKILTVSDFYCDPDFDSLREVARLAARRHGETRYANSGLSSLKSWLVREQLLELIEASQIFRDPELTLAEVAQRIGCSDEQLEQVMNREFNMEFDNFVEVQRANYASTLLLRSANEPNYLSHIAAQSGFSSKARLDDAFAHSFGMTPKEFQRANSRS